MKRGDRGSGRRRRIAAVACAAGALCLGLVSSAGAATVQVFPVPSPASGLEHITAAPDGALWFTEREAGRVGRITTAGQISEYAIPNNASGLSDTGPDEIVAGRDGALWFLSDIGESVYRMATNGSYSQVYFDELANAADLAPSDTGGVWLMMAHGDRNDQDGDALVRLDPDATVTGYPATHPNSLDAIALAPDGAVWFNNQGSYLYRLTDSGSETSAPLPSSAAAEVSSMAFTPDGTPWFTEHVPNTLTGAGCCGAIGEISGGTAHITAIGAQDPVDGIEPHSLIVGPDGALWFAFSKAWSGAKSGFDGVGRVNPATGQIQLASLDPNVPDDIAFGADGALWFVDKGANDVGRVAVDASLFGGAGAPTPGGAPPGSATGPYAPVIALKLPSPRIAVLRRTGTFRIGCQLSGAGRCSVSATVSATVARHLGLKVPRHAGMVALAHGAAVLRHAGRATVTLRLGAAVRRALARAHSSVRVAIIAVSSKPGTQSVTVTSSLLLRSQ
jgi:virginiamycin B lyase